MRFIPFCLAVLAAAPMGCAWADFAIEAGEGVSQELFAKAETLLREHIVQNYTQEFLDKTKLNKIIFEKEIRLPNGSLVAGYSQGRIIRLSLGESLIRLENERPILLARTEKPKALAEDSDLQLRSLDKIVDLWDCEAYQVGSAARNLCESQKREDEQLRDAKRRVLLSHRVKSEQVVSASMGRIYFLANYVNQLFDHEILHVIDRQVLKGFIPYSPWFSSWIALNPPEFSYFGSDLAFIAAHADRKYAIPPAGFVSDYATAAINEDKAETYAQFMFEPQVFMHRYANDAVILSKLKLLRQMLDSVCDHGQGCQIPKKFEVITPE